MEAAAQARAQQQGKAGAGAVGDASWGFYGGGLERCRRDQGDGAGYAVGAAIPAATLAVLDAVNAAEQACHDAHFRALVDRTATAPKKAEDDYDYPEDLPQVLLNRPKAAAARTKPDPESRLSYSLFGQAFDELHFMEPASLRLGYTHPMDDGQRRTFKVKFEEEEDICT